MFPKRVRSGLRLVLVEEHTAALKQQHEAHCSALARQREELQRECALRCPAAAAMAVEEAIVAKERERVEERAGALEKERERMQREIETMCANENATASTISAL